jgi:alpha-L-fucosidase
MNCTTSQTPHWFEQARYGLFMHWGLYSLLGHENAEWVLFKDNLDRAEYNRLADQFTGSRFDADALAALARRAGMNYMVLTTRHHDGFCLFDTQTTDFNSVKTAAKRDFVREHVEACRRAGLRVGLYYSVMSWQHDAIVSGPGADPEGWERMVRETHDQVRELMTNYGQIDELWYDGAVVPGIQDNGIQARFWRSRELNAMVRELQPGILINNRSGLPEDFSTPEQHFTPAEPGRRCEACMTINTSWGYNIHDRTFKSAEDIIATLIRCSRFDSNLLLNIGPRGDGTVQQECVEPLEAVGRWLACNGEAIYGAERSAYTEADHVAGPVTQKGNRLYVHVNGNSGGPIRIDGVGEVEAARILGADAEVEVMTGPGGAKDFVASFVGNFVDSRAERAGLHAGQQRSDKAHDKARDKGDGSCGPTVLALTLAKAPGSPARLLGGGDAPHIPVGNAPVLCDDPDRHAPPIVPVRIDTALAELMPDAADLAVTPGETWCPGWGDWPVYAAAVNGDPLQVVLEVPVPGRYDLELGLVSEDGGVVELTLDGEPLASEAALPHPGCPDTLDLPGLALEAGRRTLSIAGAGRLGLYALRLAPVWRPIPSESWLTIGPFPTGFGPQQPICEVRKALDHVYPPEAAFDRDTVYPGAGGRDVHWGHSLEREGEHTDVGVNFPYRCGTHASGVCYACTVIDCPEAREAVILLGCDWWAKVWVNGEPVRSERDAEACEEDGAQFNTWKPAPARVHLRQGENVVLVKCHPGSTANWFTFRISDPGGEGP